MTTLTVPQTEWGDNEWTEFSAWLSAMLASNTVEVSFTKKDGSERVMRCTLNENLLPKVEVSEGKQPKKKSSTSMAVFDVEKQEWRSFIIKSVYRVQMHTHE